MLSLDPNFGGVTDWHQSLGYRELGIFKTQTITTFVKTKPYDRHVPACQADALHKILFEYIVDQITENTLDETFDDICDEVFMI